MRRIATKTDLAMLLERHIGRDRGVTAAQIAEALQTPERTVRELVTELRMDGIAVCGKPDTGYFIAAAAAELEGSSAFLRSRATH